MRRIVLLAALVAAAVPAVAFGHAERPSYFPNYDEATQTSLDVGEPPRYRKSGPSIVVCKRDSRARTKRIFRDSPRLLRKRLRMLRRCRFNHIQRAVDAARNGDRILLMPGVYREEPSRRAPNDDPRCEDMKVESPDRVRQPTTEVPNYEYQRNCPNAQNLIAIVGDGPDEDRVCDIKCNIQIEGVGRRPRHVLIKGDVNKVNGIRADRADGIYLRNFTIQYSDGNNVYAHETNGFRFDRIVTRWSKEYGILSFTSDHGIYEYIEGYGNGDSAVYPGSGPETHCKRYGIEIRYVNAHDNNLGYSGTAGNGVYVHDSRFYDNGIGLVTDSVVPGHPGMPQDCAKFERNQIYSNNLNLYDEKRTERCSEEKAYQKRPRYLCSRFPAPPGTGLIISGNGNIVRDNRIFDNWRAGVALAYLPASIRSYDPTGQSAPAREYDVAHDNFYTGNVFGIDRRGRHDPNGFDVLWDGEGEGNCWSDNKTAPSHTLTSYEGHMLPACPEGSAFSPSDPSFTAGQVSCLTWSANDYGNYPPCGRNDYENWWKLPPEPR